MGAHLSVKEYGVGCFEIRVSNSKASRFYFDSLHIHLYVRERERESVCVRARALVDH